MLTNALSAGQVYSGGQVPSCVWVYWFIGIYTKKQVMVIYQHQIQMVYIVCSCANLYIYIITVSHCSLLCEITMSNI